MENSEIFINDLLDRKVNVQEHFGWGLNDILHYENSTGIYYYRLNKEKELIFLQSTSQAASETNKNKYQ